MLEMESESDSLGQRDLFGSADDWLTICVFFFCDRSV